MRGAAREAKGGQEAEARTAFFSFCSLVSLLFDGGPSVSGIEVGTFDVDGVEPGGKVGVRSEKGEKL